jgi:hypothetical protein
MYFHASSKLSACVVFFIGKAPIMVQITSNSFSVVIKPIVVNPAIPAWVPPAGYFADVPMLNNPYDVTPSMYAGDSMGLNSQFIDWGGSAILRDFSPLGAQVFYASGHESSMTQPNIQCALICDFSTLTWSVSNLPAAPNSSSMLLPTGMFPDGTPYAPHTYLGLQEMPAAWGGGKRGSLVSFFWAGSSYVNRINVLDVSKGTGGYSQMNTKQSENLDPTRIRFSRVGTDAGTYPITVIDLVRQGWWVAASGAADYTLFVSKTGDIKQYPALGGNMANGTMVNCTGLNLLMGIDGGYHAGPTATNAYRTLYIRNLVTGAVTTNTTLGTVPSTSDGYGGEPGSFNRPDVMGLQWVEELGCVVGFDQSTTPPTVVKLTPPKVNPASEPWTWSTLTLQHWPNDKIGSPDLRVVTNSVWSKFRWVPALQAFVYCAARDVKPQVLRIS